MRRYQSHCAALVVALPLAVSAHDSDSARSFTTLSISGGVGDYAVITRGCNNEILSRAQYPFRDYGASIDHKFAFPMRVGVRAGGLEEQDVINRYVSPHLSLEWRKFSIGYGPVYAQREFSTGSGTLDNSQTWHSGHVRIGDLSKGYFSIGYFENLPLYSGGGHFDMGGGGRVTPRLGFWGGISVEPYDGVGIVSKWNYRVTSGLSAIAKFRIGAAAGEGENAISIGAQWRIPGTRRNGRSEADTGAVSIDP